MYLGCNWGYQVPTAGAVWDIGRNLREFFGVCQQLWIVTICKHDRNYDMCVNVCLPEDRCKISGAPSRFLGSRVILHSQRFRWTAHPDLIGMQKGHCKVRCLTWQHANEICKKTSWKKHEKTIYRRVVWECDYIFEFFFAIWRFATSTFSSF